MKTTCCRCGTLASSLMAYDYASRRVWLDDAPAGAPYGFYALCERHANRLTPPATWTLSDRRRLAPLLPFARDVA